MMYFQPISIIPDDFVRVICVHIGAINTANKATWDPSSIDQQTFFLSFFSFLLEIFFGRCGDVKRDARRVQGVIRNAGASGVMCRLMQFKRLTSN